MPLKEALSCTPERMLSVTSSTAGSYWKAHVSNEEAGLAALLPSLCNSYGLRSSKDGEGLSFPPSPIHPHSASFHPQTLKSPCRQKMLEKGQTRRAAKSIVKKKKKKGGKDHSSQLCIFCAAFRCTAPATQAAGRIAPAESCYPELVWKQDMKTDPPVSL